MPSLEIICIGQTTPSVFHQLPFRIEAEPELHSHRSPKPLFQADFAALQGCIYHVLDEGQVTCFDLLDFDWVAGQSKPPRLDHKLIFKQEYNAAIHLVLEQLIKESPQGQVLFTTDYQFGPAKAKRYGPMSLPKFKLLLQDGKIRMNSSYMIKTS